MSEPGADELDRRQADLRDLLNQWDPIGVADIVNDEYDCLLAPLLHRLAAHASRTQISEYLWYELQHHFGLDPARCAADETANRLVACAAGWKPHP